jgi:hypothetical protein
MAQIIVSTADTWEHSNDKDSHRLLVALHVMQLLKVGENLAAVSSRKNLLLPRSCNCATVRFQKIIHSIYLQPLALKPA